MPTDALSVLHPALQTLSSASFVVLLRFEEVDVTLVCLPRKIAHMLLCAQVVHGTDTLAYTASALSLMLAGFRKPIVITGGLLGVPDLCPILVLRLRSAPVTKEGSRRALAEQPCLRRVAGPSHAAALRCAAESG